MAIVVACGTQQRAHFSDRELARTIAPRASDFGRGWTAFFRTSPPPCLASETACAAVNLSRHRGVLVSAVVAVFPTQAAAERAMARSIAGWRVGATRKGTRIYGYRMAVSSRVVRRDAHADQGVRIISATIRYRLLGGVPKRFHQDFIPFLADLVAFRTGRVVANVEFDRAARSQRATVVHRMLKRASQLSTN